MSARRLEAHGAVGDVLHERRARLGSELTAPSAARRLVREVLEAADRSEWRDAAELAVSEVVTNAALHAHTEIDLLLEVLADRVCVEVRDFNPAMPVQREYDDHATTGRGMSLVASITLACGVQSLGDDGKISWFCVGDEAEEPALDGLLGAWDMDDLVDEGSAAPAPVEHTDVLLVSMPVTLWLAAREHHDAILRELVLYMAGHPDVQADLAAADEARSRVSSVVAALVDEAQQTGAARPPVPPGHPSPLPWAPEAVDVVIAVPDGRASAFGVLQDVLDLAEELAVGGELLIRPGLPEIVAVRDWACEQVTAQLAGVQPSPWAGTSAEHFETDAARWGPHDIPDWDAAVVSDAGAVAADDGNRIVAVSRPFAALVGWSVEDLVGRRVVTVIPPHLREAHVAGFSRHLSTGQAHALGVPLELPVLRSDGSVVLCHFLVERAPANDGRAVYVAWIDPLD